MEKRERERELKQDEIRFSLKALSVVMFHATYLPSQSPWQRIGLDKSNEISAGLLARLSAARTHRDYSSYHVSNHLLEMVGSSVLLMILMGRVTGAVAR